MRYGNRPQSADEYDKMLNRVLLPEVSDKDGNLVSLPLLNTEEEQEVIMPAYEKKSYNLGAQSVSAVELGGYYVFTPPKGSGGYLDRKPWYGQKQLREFNDAMTDGQVIRINPKSVTVKAVTGGEWNYGREYKIPKDALATEDLTEMMKEKVKAFRPVAVVPPKPKTEVIRLGRPKTLRSLPFDRLRVFGTAKQGKLVWEKWKDGYWSAYLTAESGNQDNWRELGADFSVYAVGVRQKMQRSRESDTNTEKPKSGKALTNAFMSEIIIYGGVPMRRSDVYKDALSQTGSTKAADIFAFSKDAIPDREPMSLLEFQKTANSAGAAEKSKKSKPAAFEIAYAAYEKANQEHRPKAEIQALLVKYEDALTDFQKNFKSNNPWERIGNPKYEKKETSVPASVLAEYPELQSEKSKREPWEMTNEEFTNLSPREDFDYDWYKAHGWPEGHHYNADLGYRRLTGHHGLVKSAALKGIKIPEKVLAEYPDLRPEALKKADDDFTATFRRLDDGIATTSRISKAEASEAGQDLVRYKLQSKKSPRRSKPTHCSKSQSSPGIRGVR